MKDLTKKIAAAIQLARKLREQSLAPFTGPLGFARYTVSKGRCLQRACEANNLPDDLWYVLRLASHWPREQFNVKLESIDLDWWAEEILAGRPLESVTEE